MNTLYTYMIEYVCNIAIFLLKGNTVKTFKVVPIFSYTKNNLIVCYIYNYAIQIYIF